MHVKQEVKRNRFLYLFRSTSFLHATDYRLFMCASKLPKEAFPLTEEGEVRRLITNSEEYKSGLNCTYILTFNYSLLSFHRGKLAYRF